MNEIKIRYVHPEELINLTEDAKNYFLDLRSKDIINYEEFELILNELSLVEDKLSIMQLEELLIMNGIDTKIILNAFDIVSLYGFVLLYKFIGWSLFIQNLNFSKGSFSPKLIPKTFCPFVLLVM